MMLASARIQVQTAGQQFWTYLLTLDWLAFPSLLIATLYAVLMFYACHLGSFLGTHARTPEIASVFDSRKVFEEAFTPRELRNYAFLLLWASLATLLWSLWSIIEYAGRRGDDSAPSVSPKLPKYTPILQTSTVPEAVTQQPHLAVGRAASRIRQALVIFAFAIAFIKKQHVGTTLIYHPVDSPALQPIFDDAYTSSRGMQTSDEEILHRLPYTTNRHAEPVVPSIIHFVFGMSRDFGGRPFAFAHYLSMYSAMTVHKPSKVFFWHHYLPEKMEHGQWWFERIKLEAADMGIELIPLKARSFDNIFGNPISKFAHKADIIRLEALLEYGGIYLDLDVYTIRSYEPFLYFNTVLGLEGGVSPLPRQGLCNGLMIAARNSTFIQKWYQAYRAFSDSDWAGLSIRMPLKIAMRHPEEVLVMDPMTFFYPMWNKAGLQMVHSRYAELYGEGWDFDESRQFAYHAWSSFASRKWLNRITPDRIFEVETSFNILIRRWTTDALRRDWREAVKKGLVAK